MHPLQYAPPGKNHELNKIRHIESARLPQEPEEVSDITHQRRTLPSHVDGRT